jgi:hypothetical protein
MKDLSEDIHTLIGVIDAVKEAQSLLDVELTKPFPERSSVLVRIIRDYIIIKSFIFFDYSNKYQNISLRKLPELHREVIPIESLERYMNSLNALLEKYRNDIDRITTQRNKAIAHFDKDRYSLLGFNKELVKRLAVEGLALRESTEYKYEYIQPEELLTMPLLNNLHLLKETLSIIDTIEAK